MRCIWSVYLIYVLVIAKPGGVYPPMSGSDASILFPFGWGLSYGAQFAYTSLTVSPQTVPVDGKVKVRAYHCVCVHMRTIEQWSRLSPSV